MAKHGGLGRGLDSLIPNRISKTAGTEKKSPAKSKSEKTVPEKREAKKTAPSKKPEDIKTEEQPETAAVPVGSQEERKETGPNGEYVTTLRISLVEPNREQPRKFFDDEAIAELSESIAKYGIISPILVQKKDAHYEIIAGERRWRAAKKAGLKEVPVIIRSISNQEAVEVSLIENIQREDLNPMEEARAYQRLVKEFGLRQEDVAERVSKSRSAVTNSLRLLKLGAEVQQMVENGSISEGHARALIPIQDEALQREVANQIAEQNLSVRQTEMLVKNLESPEEPAKQEKHDVRRNALLNDLAERLKTKLGTKVSIKQKGKHKGRIEIEYYSDDELDRIYELIQSIR